MNRKFTAVTAALLAMTFGTAALSDAHGGKVKIGLITTLTGGGRHWVSTPVTVSCWPSTRPVMTWSR